MAGILLLMTPSRFTDVINVKDFGAKGDGSTDDTDSIQSAINAAFGPVSSPNGHSNPFANKPVYLPPGNYKITSPLYIAGAAGGLIFGSGNGTSQLLWRPTNGATIPGGGTYSGSGNSLIGDSQTPCICTDGVIAIRLENFSIAGPNTSTDAQVGVYISTASGTPNGQATGSTYINMTFSGLGVGILAGGGAGAGCDNGAVINCVFQDCSLAGVRTISQNALNWNVTGGGASNCAANTTFNPGGGSTGNAGAAYSCVAGSISLISGVSVSANNWDFINAGAEGMAILGGSSESVNSIGAAGAPVSVQGMSFRPGFSLNCIWIDARLSGSVAASGCWFNTNNNTGFGNIATLGNTGVVIIDGCQFGPQGAACGYTGTAGSKLYIRGPIYGAAYSALTTNFTGTIVQNI